MVVKRRVQFYIQEGFASQSTGRGSVAKTAFATILGVSSREIAVYRAYQGNKIFDLGVPGHAAERLRRLLRSNNGQLRMLKVGKVKIELDSGQEEAWAVKDGRFYLEPIPKPE